MNNPTPHGSGFAVGNYRAAPRACTVVVTYNTATGFGSKTFRSTAAARKFYARMGQEGRNPQLRASND